MIATKDGPTKGGLSARSQPLQQWTTIQAQDERSINAINILEGRSRGPYSVSLYTPSTPQEYSSVFGRKVIAGMVVMEDD